MFKGELLLNTTWKPKTFTLTTIVNDKKETYIKHMGGYALAKDIKCHMGMEFFDMFVSAAASGAVIAVRN